MKKDNFTQMTTAPIPGLIGKLAVPTIISMLVTSFYNIADTYFVGKINTQSTAAVGIVFSVMSIIQAVGFFSDTDQETTSHESWEHKKRIMQKKWRLQDFSLPCSWE